MQTVLLICSLMMILESFDNKAFYDALENGSSTVARVQLTFVGAFGAGKTNLCRNLITPDFNPESDSTRGIDFHHTSAIFVEDETGSLSMESSDNYIGPLLMEVADGRVITSEIATVMGDRKSRRLPDTSTANEQMPAPHPDQSVGEHEEGEEDRDEGEEEEDAVFPEQHTMSDAAASGESRRPYEADDTALQDEVKEVEAEVSKPGKKVFVSMLDNGGHLSYSVAQAISFNADENIFILVYNSKLALTGHVPSAFRQGGESIRLEMPDLSNKGHLKLWLSTLSMFKTKDGRKPLVVIVGTHSAGLDRIAAKALLTSELELRNVAARLDIRGPFFVDNSDPHGADMASFRCGIADLIRDKCKQAEERIPLSYLKMEWFIRRGRTQPVMSMSDFKRSAQRLAGIRPENVATLLRYLHTHCVLRLIGKRVYLNLPWLLGNVFKLLSCTLEKVPTLCPADVEGDIGVLRNRGYLTTRLANHLWSIPQLRDDVLGILESLDLLCEVRDPTLTLRMSEETGRCYYVPICVERNAGSMAKLAGDEAGVVSMPELLLRVTMSFYPYGDFARLAVLLLRHYKPKGRLNIATFHLSFYLPESPRCYIANVSHHQRGVVIALQCTKPRVAAQHAGGGVTAKAVKFRQTVEKLLEGSCKVISWSACFRCPRHQGNDSLWKY